MQFSNNITSKLLYLLGLIILLYITKPTIVFKPNGKPRQYGVGIDEEGFKKTLYTVHSVTFFGAVLIAITL